MVQRRPARRNTAHRGRRDRVYLLVLLILTTVMAVMALGPYADFTAAQGRVDALVSQQTQLNDSVAELELEATRLSDPAAVEEHARGELGMSRPGEIPYIVVNPPTEDPAPVNASPDIDDLPADPVNPSVVDRVIDWFGSLTNSDQ